MQPTHLPKMPLGRAKNIIKNLIRTQAGKRINDTKFKQFLKENKELSKYAYKNKESHLTKHETKKFFNKVIKTVSQKRGLRISKIDQKKMGVRLDKSGALSELGLNKIYQKATAEETASQAPTDPTPEEIRRQKRRETAIKTFHKHERARENEMEKRRAESGKKSAPQDKNSSSPIPRKSLPKNAGGGGPAAQTISQTAVPTQSNNHRSPPSSSDTSRAAPVLLYPIYNQTPNQPKVQAVADKLSEILSRKISSLPYFTVLSATERTKALRQLQLPELPPYEDTRALQEIARTAQAALYVKGIVSQRGAIINITITMHNTQTGANIVLAQNNQETNDFFAMLRAIEWQIDNALHAEKKQSSVDPPSASEAIDLPI